MSKFYETDAFKRLNKKWQEKLKKSGFEEAERDDGSLKSWHSFKFQAPEQSAAWRESKEIYYRMASQFLHTHKFKDKLEHTVWELHCQGISFSKIDKAIGENPGKARYIIDKLTPIMKNTVKLEAATDD